MSRMNSEQINKKIEDYQERIKLLELRKAAQIAKETNQNRKKNTKLKIIIGGAIMALKKKGREITDQTLTNYLNETVTRESDLKLVTEWLKESSEIAQNPF